MQVPRRFADEANGYRYGFQGQEEDDELKGEGNSLNYTFRMHDPRVGRFFAIDPLARKYPHYTPYSFAANQVIHSVELEGLENFNDLNYNLDPALAKFRSQNSPEENRRLAKVHNEAALKALIGGGAVLGLLYADSFTGFTVSRTLGTLGLSYSLGDFTHSMQMQTYYRDRGDEVKAKMYEPEGAQATKEIIVEGVAYAAFTKAGSLTKVARQYMNTINKRYDLAQSWRLELDYVNFDKSVSTQVLPDGTPLIQYRLKGYEGTKGSYYANPGTTPEQIGLRTEDVAETYNVTVKGNQKVIVSSHIENKAPYYDKSGAPVEGGGIQIKSVDLKDNADWFKIENP